MSNSFGRFIRFHSFGESHGAAMGVVIDGLPAGMPLDRDLLIGDLQRRRPGQSDFVTARNEMDEPQILSGIYQEKTLGTPICVIVHNQDQRSDDYSQIKDNPRPGHADDIWKAKFGHVDPRGGGRASGRETLSRVIAGAFAKMLLKSKFPHIKIISYAQSIGPLVLDPSEETRVFENTDLIYNNPLRFPGQKANQAQELLRKAKEEGDSFGGVVATQVFGLPAGVGEPVFAKLKSELASAMMSIGATSSFEVGAGVESTRMTGVQMHRDSDSSVYGGIRGGISTGEIIYFKVGFKPTSSIMDVSKRGRHDPCIVPRAASVVEAMCAWVLADLTFLKES